MEVAKDDFGLGATTAPPQFASYDGTYDYEPTPEMGSMPESAYSGKIPDYDHTVSMPEPDDHYGSGSYGPLPHHQATCNCLADFIQSFGHDFFSLFDEYDQQREDYPEMATFEQFFEQHPMFLDWPDMLDHLAHSMQMVSSMMMPHQDILHFENMLSNFGLDQHTVWEISSAVWQVFNGDWMNDAGFYAQAFLNFLKEGGTLENYQTFGTDQVFKEIMSAMSNYVRYEMDENDPQNVEYVSHFSNLEREMELAMFNGTEGMIFHVKNMIYSATDILGLMAEEYENMTPADVISFLQNYIRPVVQAVDNFLAGVYREGSQEFIDGFLMIVANYDNSDEYWHQYDMHYGHHNTGSEGHQGESYGHYEDSYAHYDAYGHHDGTDMHYEQSYPHDDPFMASTPTGHDDFPVDFSRFLDIYYQFTQQYGDMTSVAEIAWLEDSRIVDLMGMIGELTMNMGPLFENDFSYFSTRKFYSAMETGYTSGFDSKLVAVFDYVVSQMIADSDVRFIDFDPNDSSLSLAERVWGWEARLLNTYRVAFFEERDQLMDQICDYLQSMDMPEMLAGFAGADYASYETESHPESAYTPEDYPTESYPEMDSMESHYDQPMVGLAHPCAYCSYQNHYHFPEIDNFMYLVGLGSYEGWQELVSQKYDIYFPGDPNMDHDGYHPDNGYHPDDGHYPGDDHYHYDDDDDHHYDHHNDHMGGGSGHHSGEKPYDHEDHPTTCGRPDGDGRGPPPINLNINFNGLPLTLHQGSDGSYNMHSGQEAYALGKDEYSAGLASDMMEEMPADMPMEGLDQPKADSMTDKLDKIVSMLENFEEKMASLACTAGSGDQEKPSGASTPVLPDDEEQDDGQDAASPSIDDEAVQQLRDQFIDMEMLQNEIPAFQEVAKWDQAKLQEELEICTTEALSACYANSKNDKKNINKVFTLTSGQAFENFGDVVNSFDTSSASWMTSTLVKKCSKFFDSAAKTANAKHKAVKVTSYQCRVFVEKVLDSKLRGN